MRSRTPTIRKRIPRVPKAEGLREISELGKDLRAIRERIVASGEHLLSWEEFDREMAEVRGLDLDEE